MEGGGDRIQNKKKKNAVKAAANPLCPQEMSIIGLLGETIWFFQIQASIENVFLDDDKFPEWVLLARGRGLLG